MEMTLQTGLLKINHQNIKFEDILNQGIQEF
jgi:hypothetical protein